MTSSGRSFFPDDSGMIASGGRGGVESKESVDSTGLGGDIADILTEREREGERKKEEEKEREKKKVCQLGGPHAGKGGEREREKWLSLR